MSKKYYKVCKSVNGALVSGWVPVWNDRVSVKYQIGKWTYPKIPGTKLFVFEDKEDAKCFKGILTPTSEPSSSVLIFEVEAKGISRTGIFIHSARVLLLHSILSLLGKRRLNKKGYRGGHKYERYTKTAKPPTGTLFADAVKLIKKVA
jgi:hypothetical protein